MQYICPSVLCVELELKNLKMLMEVIHALSTQLWNRWATLFSSNINMSRKTEIICLTVTFHKFFKFSVFFWSSGGSQKFTGGWEKRYRLLTGRGQSIKYQVEITGQCWSTRQITPFVYSECNKVYMSFCRLFFFFLKGSFCRLFVISCQP